MQEVLRQLVQGQLASHQLPSDLNVWDLEKDFGELRRRSLGVPAEEQVEWGGCIVLKAEHLCVVHPVSGWKEGVNPKCALDDPEHDHYVGFAHTHLPDVVRGRPYMGFSERDFWATLADGDCLSLVCNGPEVFALARTNDRIQLPRVPDDAEFASWKKLYDAMAQARRAMASDPAVRRRGSDALNRALWQANRQMCQLLGFAFYRGLWGQPLVCMFRPKEERVLL